MTDEEAVEAFEACVLKAAGRYVDREAEHRDGDEFVARVLRSHGFPKLADAYDKARDEWWYE